MKAVIMAGGEGTRLRPLTCNLPKPMVPVLNRPMMEHIVHLLKRHNITEVANTLWYLPEDITEYFGDGTKWNVAMEYFIEKEPLGTAGSVKNAQAFLDETFVVVSGDSLTDIDLTQAIDFHRRNNSLATIVLTKVANPLNYGVVITNDEGRITQFLEKPSWSEVFSDTVNTGIYVLEPDVLDLFDPGEKFDFSKDLFPRLLKEKAPLFGYIAEGYWSDVGTLEVYRQSHRDCLSGEVKILLPPEKQPGVFVEEGAEIPRDVEIEGPVLIGRNAQIQPGCKLGPFSVIGRDCFVGEGTSLKRTILWPGVRVEKGCELRGVVLAKNATINQKVKIFEGAVIGEKTTVDSQTIISPNVRIWPEKWIASGSRVKDTLVWGHQEGPGLFSKEGISGDIRGDMSPENIVKVGLSYGAFSENGKPVLVTTDGSSIGRVAKRALIAGLLSSGVDVYDGGTVSGNLTRFGVQKLKTSGALHCQKSRQHENRVVIQCWDDKGLFLSKDNQRKLENLFLREDFPRVSSSDFGKLHYVPGLIEQYINAITELYKDKLNNMEVNLVVKDGGSPEFAGLVKEFLRRAGCRIVFSSEPKAMVAIVIDGEGWHFKDEKGADLTEDEWWRLFVRGMKEKGTQGTNGKFAVPVHASKNVADVANEETIAWTRLEPRFWMETASELGNVYEADDGRHAIQFFPYVEPLVSIGEVLSLVNTNGGVLSNLCPAEKTHRRSGTVLCPWDQKGRVMRELIHSTDPERTVYLDGIKQLTDSGWVLVVPDGDDPVFKIFSESETEEEADRLMGQYQNLVRQYVAKMEAERG